MEEVVGGRWGGGVPPGKRGERRDEGEVPVETLEMRTAALNLLAARQLVDRNFLISSWSNAVLRRA